MKHADLKLIGLSGPAGSGKDTVAEHLADCHEFYRVSLADPIRRGLSEMFGIAEH